MELLSLFVLIFIPCSVKPQAPAAQKTLNSTFSLLTLKVEDDWEPPDETKKSCPYYISGYDYERRLVFVIEAGRWNFRKIVEGGGKNLENMGKHLVRGANYVKCVGSNNALDKDSSITAAELGTTRVVIILDLEKFDFIQLASSITVLYLIDIARLLTSAQDAIDQVYMVNVNFAAQTIINVVKPIFGTLLERIDVFGTNKNAWIPKLLKTIPPDSLPVWYGGSEDFKPLAISTVNVTLNPPINC